MTNKQTSQKPTQPKVSGHAQHAASRAGKHATPTTRVSAAHTQRTQTARTTHTQTASGKHTYAQAPRPKASATHTPRTQAQAARAARAQARATRAQAGDSTFAFSRRTLIGGAVGIGALAAVGGGVAIAIQKSAEANSAFDELDVPASNMTRNSDLNQVEDPTTCMTLTGKFELPLGTLVWANDNTYAACLMPTEGANPLNQVGLLSLSSGTLATVLKAAVGASENFEIYDVRASDRALIWVEANILDGKWRVYSAKTSQGTLSGNPVLLEEQSTSDWETPSITVVSDQVFWQVQPQSSGEFAKENSALKQVSAGADASTARTICTSKGHFACAPYGGSSTVTVVPYAEGSSTYYQMTAFDAQSGDVRDSCVLPATYVPSHAGYGATGFMFCLDAIYNKSDDDGIGNLGTYCPVDQAAAGADASTLNSMKWFSFERTPLAAPCWCGNYFMVKSTSAICGINLSAGEYFSYDVDSGADDWGEFLATEGERNNVVTFTNIDHTPLSGNTEQLCRVKVYTPASA